MVRLDLLGRVGQVAGGGGALTDVVHLLQVGHDWCLWQHGRGPLPVESGPGRLHLVVQGQRVYECCHFKSLASTRRALNPENVFLTKPTFCILNLENSKNPYRLQLFAGVARIVIRKQNP